MTTHIGNDGTVEVGANQVAEVVSFSVSEAANTADDTALNDTYQSHKVGTLSWSGSLSAHRDPSDTNGQEALTIGAEVTLNLFPTGNTSGQEKLSGTATITGIENTTANDAINAVSFSFTGNGALTKSTVTP